MALKCDKRCYRKCDFESKSFDGKIMMSEHDKTIKVCCEILLHYHEKGRD